MAGNIHIDIAELEKFRDTLEKLQQSEIDKLCEASIKELTARLLAKVIKRTPVGKAPKINGKKTVKVKSENGKTRSFLTSEGARYEQYWAGYVGGTLRRGWISSTYQEAKSKKGAPSAPEQAAYLNNISIRRASNNYVIEIKNPIEYASYVEFGHRQQPGRYVPAIGKTLKEAWVPGKFMLTLSEEEIRRDAPRILERKVNKWLKEMFRQ